MKRLTWFVVGFLIALLAGCAPAPSTPSIVRETVTVIVKETVQVTVPVPVTVTPAPTPTLKRGSTLIIARAEDVSGLDPHKQSAPASLRAIELLYDPLLTFDPDLKVIPNLAEAWKWSDDGRALTITLRANVKFHNGDPLTADDVKFSFERILDDKTFAAARAFFTDIDRIEVADPATVTFRLKRVNAAILAAMAHSNAAIVSKKFVTSGGAFNKESAGTGAFKLTRWEPGRVLTLTAHKDFWIPGLPRVDGVEFRTVADDAAVLAGLRAQTFDFGILNDWRVVLRAQTSPLTITRARALGYYALMLNSSRRAFNDARVRQAIACALDRQEVLDLAAFGEGQVTGPATPPYYRANVSDLFCYQKDWGKARQLLTDAGRASGLRFKLMLPSENPTLAAAAQNIQTQLRRAGVETDLEVLEPGVYGDRWYKADFDAALASPNGYPDPDVMLAPYWHSTGEINRIANYRDAELDKLLEQGRATLDPEKRKPIYDQIQKRLTDAVPWVWLFSGYDYRVMQPHVKGFTPLSNGSLINAREIWMDK
ncbi:MAG: ABC transporter substrate-binding protein [Chloroflexi bacterium]|nr:ABC transporter substrate-binding protein [Chloroflexota bacterium]